MAGRGKALAVDEKRGRSRFRTREAMDFDPSPTILSSQEEVVEYLEKYPGSLPSGIVVEWCPFETNVRIPPPEGGMYFQPQVLVLMVHLPLTDFVRQVPAYYNVVPTQLMLGAWRTILGFEALCVDFAAASYSLEDFTTCYLMQRLLSVVCSFSPGGTRLKLIVNLSDSDHEWNSTIVFWDAAIENDCGNVLTSWSTGAFAYGSELISAESEKWAKKLYQIEYDKHNWSGC